MSRTMPAAGPPGPPPRSVVVAILLNFFGAGAGYLYLGRPWRALALAAWSAASLLVWFGPWGRVLASPTAALALTGLALAGLAVALCDTVMMARRAADAPRPWYASKPVYAMAILAWFVAGSADLVSAGAIRPAVKSYHVPSRSMEPGLGLGERFLADMRAYAGADGPRRGDVIVFRHPRQANVTFVKRVIGLPGERVRLEDGVVHINGEPVPITDAGRVSVAVDGSDAARGAATEPAQVRVVEEQLPGGPRIRVHDATPKGAHDWMPEISIGPGQYFVLGDNRDNSIDSRLAVERGGVGLVPRALIEGRAAWIYWSMTPGRLLQRL